MKGRKHTKESKELISKHRKGKSTESERWNWKGDKSTCVDCGKKLSRRKYKRCNKCNLEIVKNRLKNFATIGAQSRWKGHIKTERKISKKHHFNISHDPKVQLEKKRFRNQRYKANKKNATGTHIFIEWLLLKEKYKNMCLCCKRFEPEIKLTEDHIVPLSIGGTDNIDNIQPLCQICNTKKYTKTINYRYFEQKGGELTQIYLS